MSIRAIYQWVKQFREGRTSTHDDAREGRPSTSVNEETIGLVRHLLATDRRLTLTDLHHQMAKHYSYLPCSRTSIFRILRGELEMTKVSARWVPRDLTDDHRQNRMGAALEILGRYAEKGDKFLQQIVTGDESWVHYWTPESKQASMVWKTKDESAPKKFKVVPSSGKLMVTFFWDSEGPLLIEYMPAGSTITGASYFDTLVKLQQAIKNKRPGKLSKGVILLHDNARPRVARLVKGLLVDFRWEVFCHPPYSPDLAPSDFHAFPGLKKHLGGQRFRSDEELKFAVNNFFQKQDGDWYHSGIEKLVPRYNKCLDLNGTYVEK